MAETGKSTCLKQFSTDLPSDQAQAQKGDYGQDSEGSTLHDRDSEDGILL